MRKSKNPEDVWGALKIQGSRMLFGVGILNFSTYLAIQVIRESEKVKRFCVTYGRKKLNVRISVQGN